MKFKFLSATYIALCFCLSDYTFAETQQVKNYTIEQFLNTKKYGGGAFNFNETRILFSSDESGVFNVYSTPIMGGVHVQLTTSTNQSYKILSSFPNDERFLFTSDALGNELTHIFLHQPNGNIIDLTPDANAKSEFYRWSHDQKSFFFLSNKRDPKFMDLYEMDIDNFESSVIYQNHDGLEFGSLSSDKHYLALTRTISSNNSELYLYDLTAKSLQLLFPHHEDIQYNPFYFSKDSRHLYFLTDENHEFIYLKQLHLESGKAEIIEKYPWDISFCHFSYNDKYRVIGINEDGSQHIKIYDQQTNKQIVLPKLPEGEITHVSISKSEKAMLFYVNGDRSPNNLYYYNFENDIFCKLTNSLSPEMNSDDLVDAEIIRYPSYDGTLIPALYYKPKNFTNDMKIPALLWIHGGPGGQSTVGYNYLIQYLVNHGYPVLCVNNRGSSGYGKSFFKSADHKHGQADLDDCIWAKHFLVGTGHIDKDKIGIMGGSYGGYITLAALAFRSDEMALGVDIFGVSNWVRTLKSIPPWWESHRDALYKKIGNPEIETAYLESISPLFHATNIKKPLLVIQGANDPRVLKIESDQMIEAVQKNGVPNEYVVFDDEGHGFLKKQNQMKVATIILQFLRQHLRLGGVKE